jgi:3-deoxy-D-manno-octulosonic-acid transferase
MIVVPKFFLKLGYNLAFTLGFAVAWPLMAYLIWRRKPMWGKVGERFGHYPEKVKAWLRHPDRPVWIHAVSVGEVLLARVLIREMRKIKPNLRVFLTVGTPTGRRTAESLQDERTCLTYVPTDFYHAMMRAFRRVHPRLLILVENEIWPNMIWRAGKMGTPVCLVNSRLSRRNRGLLRFAQPIVQPVFQLFDWVGVQSVQDLHRLGVAGFPEKRLHLMGSMKYDVADLVADDPGKAQEILLRLGWTRGQVILLAGSTHPGEEEILLRLFDGLRGKHPQLRLVLVPRHAERAGSILKIARAAGFSVILRSKLEHPFLPDPQILVVDTTGELRDLYPAGDLVFIGKTLTGTGGQNFLEPARYGRAIFSGPHMENFQSLRDEFVQDRAMLICPDEESLRQEITRLLEAPEARQELGRRARACFQKHLGAGARHAEALVRLLGPEI